MTCREFMSQIEGSTLIELDSANPELLAHQSGCASCAALLQERQTLAAAMQVLRTRTAGMEAPSAVEQNVLRAFRQNPAVQPAAIQSPSAFRWSNLFGWPAYAAAAAVLVIGLGWWFAQQGGNGTQHPAANTEQAAQPRHQTSPAQKDDSAPLPVPASASIATVPGSGTDTAASSRANVTTASLIQTEQAQGYTPLMLCDPLSCSEDAQVVRMELPATAADGSTATQMADVIVGDDGLVRAIRIVQQQ